MITPNLLIGKLEKNNSGVNSNDKLNEDNLPNTSSKMHVAISQVAIVEDTYQKIAERYSFLEIKTPHQAINCGAIVPVKKQNANGQIVVVNEFHKCKSIALARKDNPEQAMALVSFMLAKTIKAFNIDNNMDVEQIKEATINLMNDFYYMNLGEIYYVLRQGRMGKFGRIYNRIDESVLYEWFMEYDQERTTISVEKHLAEHDKATSHETSRKYDNFFDNLLRERNKEESNKIKEQAYKMAQKMTNNAMEDYKLKQEYNKTQQTQQNQETQQTQNNQPE